ncbi:MAG TPA: hypothetical protein VGQ22_07520 [Steroidobacteraceae bacterium]|jgi:hypothetical protein|nr:hypothetical protein [Steroidobacteraceae bacterium]
MKTIDRWQRRCAVGLGLLLLAAVAQAQTNPTTVAESCRRDDALESDEKLLDSARAEELERRDREDGAEQRARLNSRTGNDAVLCPRSVE